MASIGGVSSGNMSSIYGNRNVISGLASGMDTEAMIQNSVSGLQLKISGLQQKQTSLGWKQEAYRGITDKLVAFSRKYTSYTSSTNLMSASFFNRAVLTTTGGANADKISASGRSTSDILINGVAQLASASRYQSSKSEVLDTTGGSSITANEAINLEGDVEYSTVSGSMGLTYGNKQISIDIPKDKIFANVGELAKEINEQLGKQNMTVGDNTGKANEFIRAKVEGNKLVFEDAKGAGNTVKINGMGGALASTFGVGTKDGLDFSDKENPVTSLNFAGKELKGTQKVMDALKDETMTFTLDGISKKVKLPGADEIKELTDGGMKTDEAFTKILQKNIDNAFGGGKITVSDTNSHASDPGIKSLQLEFTVKNQGSSLAINTNASKALGMDARSSTYLNTGKTLGELLGDDLGGLIPADAKPLMGTGITVDNKPLQQKDGSFRDYAGNLVNAAGERLGKDGNVLFGADMVINGVKVGTYTRDTAMDTVLVDINANADVALKVTYSQTTNQFVFNAKETGSARGIAYDDGGLTEKIFGKFADGKYEEGTDAIFSAKINGSDTTLVRSNNTFDIDGLSVTLKETFNNELDTNGKPVLDANGKPTFVATPKDPVSFSTAADEDKIVTAIQDFVKDYNEMVTELRKAFNTLPAEKINGSRYEPLTESDLDSMSESAIKNYEEKAKQGLLFADRDLSSLYTKLTKSISPGGSDMAMLRSIGIGSDYSSGLSTINLDETALRDALKNRPDDVANAFTKTAGSGGSNTDGLMASLKDTLDAYAAVEGRKGILIDKAGSKYSATSLLENSLKKQSDAYDEQMLRLQDQLANKVDYFTRQFSRLEQIVAQSNNQSSTLMGMMMGGSQ